MNTPINEETLNRLAKAIMVKHSVGYEEAVAMLSRFRLNIVCDDSIRNSPSRQAALLTAINTGKRAFHGGVTVSMPPNIPCLFKWPGNRTLNSIANLVGARFGEPVHDEFSHTLFLVQGKVAEPVEGSFALSCSGWRGGIIPAGMTLDLAPGPDFALGGIAAAALGVAHGFLRVSGISTRMVEEPQGISLWRPDFPWTTPEAVGPTIEILPKNLWMLGLGHLGQGYLWALSFLPFAKPDKMHFLLQDFDKAVVGNFTSGLLCETHNVGKRKTRLCADWLEDRGFCTTIVERPFDASTVRAGDEPYIACCGFDSAEPRRLLESAGFDLVVECALGSETARFDRIILHTFPDASKTAKEIWAATPSAQLVDKNLVEQFTVSGDCGILAETLARKAISTSFAGAFAGALVAGELLRALHGGIRCEYIHCHLRHGGGPKVIVTSDNYLNRVARSGFTNAAAAGYVATCEPIYSKGDFMRRRSSIIAKGTDSRAATRLTRFTTRRSRRY
jgi:hypothetical protein